MQRVSDACCWQLPQLSGKCGWEWVQGRTEVPHGKRGEAGIATALEVVSFAGVCDQGHFPDLLEYCPKYFVFDFNRRYLKLRIFFLQWKRDWKLQRKKCQGATGAFSACDSSWPCGTSAGLLWGASCFEQGQAKAGEIFDFPNCSLTFRVFEQEFCVTEWANFSVLSGC